MWADWFTAKQRKDDLSAPAGAFTFLWNQTAHLFRNTSADFFFFFYRQKEERIADGGYGHGRIYVWALAASLAPSLPSLLCFCLGSLCLALAPEPTHTSAPLPTLWTRCLKSSGGSASYAWEKGMSCVDKRRLSEPGRRRFLRSVSCAPIFSSSDVSGVSLCERVGEGILDFTSIQFRICLSFDNPQRSQKPKSTHLFCECVNFYSKSVKALDSAELMSHAVNR